MLAPETLTAMFISEVMPSEADDNMAVSLALAGLAFAITVIIGRPFITFLRVNGIGKQIRAENSEHEWKMGTPTMGGLMFVASVLIVTLVFNTIGRYSMLLPIGVLTAASVLGAVDDLMNLTGGKKSSFTARLLEMVGRRTTGMTARFKFAWLMTFGLTAALILHVEQPLGLGLHMMYVPFLGQYDIGWLYVPIATFAILAMSNAVNLTDGMDTLAAGTAAIAFVAFGIIAYRQGQVGVVTFCFTMVGALAGFLWFNAHPAQVFMGDTGSLAIGASLAVAAFMTGQWLLLPIVGIVFVSETISVMMQVGYFKLTKGKRIFRMTPIHHHFQLLGWSETQVTLRFWLVGVMAGLLGCALALI